MTGQTTTTPQTKVPLPQPCSHNDKCRREKHEAREQGLQCLQAPESYCNICSCGSLCRSPLAPNAGSRIPPLPLCGLGTEKDTCVLKEKKTGKNHDAVHGTRHGPRWTSQPPQRDVGTHTRPHARRGASRTHTRAHRRSALQTTTGGPSSAGAQSAHGTAGHKTGSRISTEQKKKGYARRSSHSCRMQRQHDGPRTHDDDTEAHARHKTPDRQHGSPYGPATLSCRFSGERSKSAQPAPPSSSSSLPKKLPPRLLLQRYSSAKNNDAGTHKVVRTQKRKIMKHQRN